MSAQLSSVVDADWRTDSWLSFLTSGRGFRGYAVLTLLCVVLYLPGIASIPPTDRDEARFMQATKQMIETGDYINIRFQDEPRNKKPAGIHWMQVAAVKAVGLDVSTLWPYRLPSFLGAWAAVIACCAFGRRLADPKTGFVAGLVLATSFMVVVEAHIAKTDAMLLGTAAIALGALAALYIDKREGRAGLALALLFWASLAAATLVKGPVLLAIVLATMTALAVADRSVAWFGRTRPLVGVPIFLLATLPWLVAVSGGDNNNNFVVEAVRGDLIPKLVGGQESHGAPPGAHLAASVITLWPWSLLLPFAVVFGWRLRAQPIVRFCLAWLVGSWVLFEVVPTKLPHYTLPAFPAVALLIGLMLRSGTLTDLIRTPAARLYRGFWALITLALSGGVVVATQAYGTHATVAAIAAIVVLGLTACIALAGWRSTNPLVFMTAGSATFAVILAAAIAPRLSDLAVSSRLAATIAPYRATSDRPVAMAGYSEPSAVFLLGTDTILTDTASVRDHVLANPGAVGVVESDRVEEIGRIIAQTGGTLRKLADVVGYNYSRGDRVALSVVTVVASPNQP